jgi:outer membrane lipoprotein-sorting protein
MNDNEKYIEEFVNDIPFDAPNEKHRDELKNQLLNTFPKHRLQPTVHTVNVWRTIMKSRISKLAAAAVIIIAVLIGTSIFKDSSSVAWGEVLNNVQKIKSCIHRIKMTVTAGPEQTQDVEFTLYRSTGFGTRRDSYFKDELISKLYIPAEGNTGVELVPSEKKYVEAVFTDEQIKEITQKNDPKEIVKEFMCCNNYTKLGSKTIDGIEVEGIEVENEQFGATLFERGKGRLWVAVDTDLPVLIELEGVSAGGSVQISMTIDGFDWNADLQASDFEPNIPSDYTVMAKVDLSGSIEAVIKGLRGFANITGGRYPGNLDLMTTGKEIGEAYFALRKKQGKSPEEKPTQEEMENILSIQGACMFYGKLVKENKDVAYYGDKVTPKDTGKVLMRWKISDDEYRVIFGDLTTKDVSAQQLAELEK